MSWSHYRALLSVNDPKKRDELAKRAYKEKWGRDRLREEVKKQSDKSEPKPVKLEAIPGKLIAERGEARNGGVAEAAGDSVLPRERGDRIRNLRYGSHQDERDQTTRCKGGA